MRDQNNQSEMSVARLCGWSLGYAWRRWPQFLGVVGAMLLKVGLDVLKPVPMAFLIDYVFQGESTIAVFDSLAESLPGAPATGALIGWSVGATIIIFLLSWLVGLIQAYTNISFGQRMIYDLAADLFARLQQLSLRFHTSKSVGDTIRRVTADCSCVATIVKDALVPVLSALISLVVMFVIMWRLNPTLTLLALAVVPCMVLGFLRYARPMMEGSYQQQEVEGRIYDVVEESFTAIPVVHAFSRENLNERRFHQATDDALAATLSLTKVQLKFKLLMGLAIAVGTAGIWWFGATQALAGGMTIGTIIWFLSYLGSLYAPLESVMYTTATIQAAAGSARRVLEVMSTEREVTDKPGAHTLPKVKGEVKFERVTYGYVEGRPVLHEINLAVQPGETLALVGPTGAGKSTLVSLIPRFFDPQQGRVIIDGQDLRDVTLRSLREQVSLVLQEPFLFPLTVAENIAYGRPQATMAEIEAAARAANAHEFILRLPEKYQTVLGERGARLSGGERQRMSIARALLKNAPILILDEPTSALDVETERLLLEALERLTEGRTTFIIAHRLSTVRRADRIVVLQEGRIVEMGTHQQLLARGQVYAGLHAIQFGQPAPNRSATQR